MPTTAFADFSIQNGGAAPQGYGSNSGYASYSTSSSSGYATPAPTTSPTDPYAAYSAASPSTAYADPTAGYNAAGYYTPGYAAAATAYPSAPAGSSSYGVNSTLPAFQSQGGASAPNAYAQASATANYYAQRPAYPSYGTDPAATPSLAAVPSAQSAVYDPSAGNNAQPQIIQNTQSPDYSYASAAFETNGYPPQPAPQQQPYPPQGYAPAPQAYGSAPYAPQQQQQPAPYGASSYGMSGYAPSYGAPQPQPAPQAFSNNYAQGVYPQQQPAAPSYGSGYAQQPSYAAADPMQPYGQQPQQAYAAPAPYTQAPSYGQSPAPSYPSYGTPQDYAMQQPYAPPPSYAAPAYAASQPAYVVTPPATSYNSDQPRVHVTSKPRYEVDDDMDEDEDGSMAPSAGPTRRPGSFYVALKTGLSIPRDSKFTDTTNGDYDEAYKMGWEFGGAAGYSFAPLNNWLAPRAELEVSSHRGSIDEITVGGTTFSDPAAFGDVNTWRVFTNGYLDFNTPWRRWFTPWIGGGVGIGFADFDRLGTSATSVALSDSGVGFAYNAAVGLTFPLWSPNSMIDLGYRYTQVMDIDLKTIDGTSTTADVSSHEFTLGFRQNFATGGLFY
ncbi:MAG: hypothetical protein HY053_04845 [Proteobacteria bacterium]|nr:hypothetical protein [Pseudomonadota bacterium]